MIYKVLGGIGALIILIFLIWLLVPIVMIGGHPPRTPAPSIMLARFNSCIEAYIETNGQPPDSLIQLADYDEFKKTEKISKRIGLIRGVSEIEYIKTTDNNIIRMRYVHIENDMIAQWLCFPNGRIKIIK